MPIYYAEVHAKKLLPEHIGQSDARGLLVRYLLAASNIDSAMGLIRTHAYEHYLDRGEVVLCHEVDRDDALNHPVTVDLKLDIDDPGLFEVTMIGSYGNINDGFLKRCWYWISDLF